MKTRTSLAFLAMALAMLLGACGGGSGGGAATPPVVTPPPATMADAFYSAVLALIGSSPEDKEPVAVEGIAPTAPDNTEPAS
jgi:ABC-type glycerol-3-phosphate transport system substrate-binding protein